MPRRTGRRCPERAAAALDAATEWSLTIWGGLGILGAGCETLEDYRTAWRLHRESILPRYISQLPGRRPWAQYVLGEIPPRLGGVVDRVHGCPIYSVWEPNHLGLTNPFGTYLARHL